MDRIQVQYEADLKKLKADLNQLENELRGVEGTAKKSSKAVEDGFNNSGKSVNTLQSTLSKALPVIAGVFAIERIISFGKGVIDITAKFQKFEAVLTNTLGSKSAAQEALNMIKEFAAKTPFAVDELTASFVKLANQGFKPTENELRKLGDLASSQGKSFDQLTEALIDAQTGQFERLKEFGIRASKEGDKVKFTFKGIETQTDFTNDSIQKYILSLGDLQGVSGGMAAISQTLGGKLSNLGDSFDALQVALGNELAETFSSVISMFGDALNGLTGLIDGSDNATASWQRQREAVDSLEKNTVPLIDRYEELSKKSNRSKTEQDELDKIIVQIGKDIPTAITQFDEYGKAIGISSNEARKFVEQQKAILAIKNKESIEEQEKALKKLNSQLLLMQVTLNAGTKTVTSGAGTFAATTREVKLTSEEILKLQEEMSNLQFEKLGVTGLLDELKGVKKEVKVVEQETKKTEHILTEFEKAQAEERKRIHDKELSDRVKSEERFRKIKNDDPIKDLNIQAKTEIEAQKDKDKKIHEAHLKSMLKFKKEVTDPIIKAGEESTKKQTENELQAEKDKQNRQKVALDTAIQGVNMITDAIGQAQQRRTDEELAQSEARTDNELLELERKKELGGITEDQFQKRKEAILSAGKAREVAIKTKDAQNDKKLALFRIAVDTAAAIIKGIVQFGPPPSPAGITAIASASALGLIEAGIVLATPIPKFSKGVTRMKGKGSNTSDSNLALLSNNESVITAKASIENEKAIDAMNRGDFKKYIERNHVLPALRKANESKHREDMNFANNINNMYKLISKKDGFYDGNIVRAIKKKDSYKMENVGELARAINKYKSEDRY